MKGEMRFGMKGKLSPRFIRPFEILDRVGDLAYQIALPLALLEVHNVFHISILRKYISYASHVITYESLEPRKDLTYENNQSRY